MGIAWHNACFICFRLIVHAARVTIYVKDVVFMMGRYISECLVCGTKLLTIYYSSLLSLFSQMFPVYLPDRIVWWNRVMNSFVEIIWCNCMMKSIGFYRYFEITMSDCVAYVRCFSEFPCPREFLIPIDLYRSICAILLHKTPSYIVASSSAQGYSWSL